MIGHADPSQVPGLSRFFKTGPGQYGEGDQFLGIKVPVTREVVRSCWKSVTFDDLEECISSPYHEVRLAALLTLVEIFSHARKASSLLLDSIPSSRAQTRDLHSCHSERNSCHSERNSCHSERSEESIKQYCIDFYLSHTAFINNWDLVDLSCYPLLGVWLLDKDRSLLYDLARHGKSLWEQRIGIVSTMTFVRHGQLSDTFAIADILLRHPHDLIHKAVGWLLREAGKKDKSALVTYLQGPSPLIAGSEPRSPRYTVMPRTMLRYAIEKFPESERHAYLSGHVSLA